MRKRVTLLAVGIVLAIIVVPVLIAQISPQQSTLRPPIDLGSMAYEDIRFTNAVTGIDLAGMLFVPEGETPFPAVVMIHGSGTSRRANSWYLTYARYLRDRGILVLLPDKRGSESSQGNWRTASLEDLATDTQSAIAYLREERQGLAHAIGALGVSQGGVIAPIVAATTSDLDFVINVVGNTVSMHEQLLYEENNNLREMGFLPGISDVLARATTFVGRNLSGREFWSAVGDFDPLPYWSEVDMPALVLFGDQDTNVPSFRSRDRLNALGKENIRVVVFEGSGHGLQAPAGVAGDYQREDALAMIANFIREASPRR